MEAQKGILLTEDCDIAVQPVRDAKGLIVSGLLLGESVDQQAFIVLRLRQGEWKEDPLLGCGLTKFLRGKYKPSTVENRIRIHFTRAGIDYTEYRNRIRFYIDKIQK
ncbi:hypothetical protein EZS27_016180 [termite gut metagenome]|jgi:hypothetical protein|uniref:Uncharacterized protein n=1 Tax=termite gut metagenome TaxID=433724 RepID=A0A5J4RRG5_9ZZZZ